MFPIRCDKQKLEKSAIKPHFLIQYIVNQTNLGE